MRERLYLAGYPSTALGWIGFSLAMLLMLAGTILISRLPAIPFLLLLLASWAVNLAVIHRSFRTRFLCHLPTWIILWRALLPGSPWYQVVPAALLLAGAVVWEQERRKRELLW